VSCHSPSLVTSSQNSHLRWGPLLLCHFRSIWQRKEVLSLPGQALSSDVWASKARRKALLSGASHWVEWPSSCHTSHCLVPWEPKEACPVPQPFTEEMPGCQGPTTYPASQAVAMGVELPWGGEHWPV
jgi:hypothetical protein